MPVIVVEDLRKTYKSLKKEPGIKGSLKALFARSTVDVHAVRGVSFTVEEGELVGFLGPNGAGKTTTLKILSGIMFPTSGTATVLGHVPWERKNAYLRQISLVMGQKNQLWWDLPPMDSFALIAEIYSVPSATYKQRLDELCGVLDLTPLLNTQVRKLSLGERMKCELVAALLYAPRVVYLDEPTIGLDVVSQKRIREFLRTYQSNTGSTIILTSHYMQDIQELCDRVVIIDHGEKIFDDRLEILVTEYSEMKRLTLDFSREVAKGELEAYGNVLDQEGSRAVLEVPRDKTASIAAQILQTFPVIDIAIQEAEAEEIIRALFTRSASSATATTSTTVK